MKQKLIQKAQELRQHGFTTGEIADELNVSMDTARWLTLQKTEEVKAEAAEEVKEEEKAEATEEVKEEAKVDEAPKAE